MKTLIVEDEFTSRIILQKFLSAHSEVQVSVNGHEGLEAYRAALDQDAPFDLVCMDVMMPEMDGPTALTGIRALEQARGIETKNRVKVLMTTGLGESDNALDNIRGLYDGILTKPVRLNTLMAILTSLGFV